MVAPVRPPANGFVKAARKVYNPLGFQKGYNFILFFIFFGGMVGFTLARFQYLNYNGIFCGGGTGGAAPGECYYYTKGFHKIGMMLHLFCIIPAGFLASFQFVPVIRHKLMLFHRLNGYLVVLLALVSNAGALMIARIAFGGGFETQTVIGLLAIITTGALFMAYYNIKRLQIDQHRAWMLRAWFYLGVIITTRVVMILAALVFSRVGSYYTLRPCYQIAYVYDNLEANTTAHYPECASYFNGTNPKQLAAVNIMFLGGRAEEIGTALGFTIGTAIWLCLFLHAFGVEIYLSLTPREAERLRKVSYQRQLEAGFKHPGSAGLTVDRWGDADPWHPSETPEGPGKADSSSSLQFQDVGPK